MMLTVSLKPDQNCGVLSNARFEGKFTGFIILCHLLQLWARIITHFHWEPFWWNTLWLCSGTNPAHPTWDCPLKNAKLWGALWAHIVFILYYQYFVMYCPYNILNKSCLLQIQCISPFLWAFLQWIRNSGQAYSLLMHSWPITLDCQGYTLMMHFDDVHLFIINWTCGQT